MMRNRLVAGWLGCMALTGIMAPGVWADPAFDPVQDDPALPRVLLIGDSISIGYTLPVRQMLKGKANVHRIPENGAFSQNGLDKIESWLGQGKWDVIHFNFGIWDTHLLDAQGSLISGAGELAGKTGHIRTPIPQYRANLEKLIAAMDRTGAKLIWATTTPVMLRTPARLKDIPKYNAAAAAVMAAHGVLADDLYSLVMPRVKELQTEDRCHFTPEGYEYLGGQVAQSIMAALHPDPRQAEWDARQTGEQTLSDRRVVRFEQDCLPEWGYMGGGSQYFYVVEPRRKGRGPLLVCLHSAGGTGESELAANVGYTAAAGDEFTGLVLNSDTTPTWWWGAHEIKAKPQSYRAMLTPTENRVLATVEWALGKYGLDKNRVYLRGISMGGSGTLGIGMAHGDVFAAVMAGVPAYTEHAQYRLKYPVAASLPDSPPALVFFSHKDHWSKGMEGWLECVRTNRLAQVAAWGPWGHLSRYDMTNPAAYEFPWMTLRKDQAYPAFTDASSDEKYPGLQSESPDQNGQMNAYFRWKVLEDRPDGFAIELRLVRKGELKGAVELPKEVVSDVSLRRIQRFAVAPGRAYTCSVETSGRLPRTQVVTADHNRLITIPDVKVTSRPVTLRLTRQ